jgi:hypothetical protein
MRICYRWERQKKRNQYEDQDVGAWIILKRILGGMDWIDLAQDRDSGGLL